MAESRLTFENQGGMNLVNAPDLLRPTEFAYLQNTRKLLGGRMTARPPMSSNLLGGTLPAGATSVSRLNDPYLPGYALVVGAAGVMYVSTNGAAPSSVVTGLSGDPLSFLPYRPAGTPRPWDYVADPSMAVTIPDYITSGYGTVAGMLKVRADGLVRKTGIMEPQSAPVIAVATGTGPNWVTYRYVYRDSTTQAVSNPSPESAPQIVPQTSVFGTQAAGTGGTANPNISFNTSQYQFEYFNGSNQIRTEGGVAAGTLTDYVVAANFSLNAAVPTGVTVDGVSVALNWNGQQNDTGVIANVALYYAGAPIGETKSPGTQNTLSGGTSVYGGGGDPWGAILTPDVVNDPTFGFGVQILAQDSGGTDRSFLYTWTITVYYTTLSSTGTCTGSLDPQVDTIDVYRQTPGLENFTYVLSVPNSSPSFGDSLPDLAIATNPILSYQNYEPFPSIDLPRSGICTVGAVNQEVSSIAILSPGTGQTNGTFNISGSGGGGTGAEVQIVIAGGVITTATVTAGGSGYTSAPTFTVAVGGTPGTLAATLSPVLPLGPNVTWVSGDTFNVRWLPGTIILIQQPGSNSSVAYVLYNRPGSTTELTAYTTTTSATGFIGFSFPPAGTNLTWQIAEPDLAAQPSPVIWGPTPDNAGSFYFGLDPNNPGDLVWSLGNNFDSASDSNRLYVTSPSEMLMNGTVTSELSTVFSTDRFWLIYPNFSDAVAAVTGTLGQQWSLVQSASTRGLYMRYAIGALGSLIAWRGKDGIFVSQGGGPEQEISTQIYNLFPHSQPETPAAVVIGENTVYPPDDTKPNAQTITLVPGYIFYDYQDTTGFPRTLVYDMEAKGWSVDTYTPTANCHSWAIGDVNQILLGCTDGTVRQFANSGPETGSAIIATGCQNGGSPRTVKRIGGVFLRALAASAITPQFWANRYAAQITGVTPSTLGTGAAESDYFADFTSATGADVLDLACQFSFALGSGDWLKEWMPDWTSLPEQIVAWRTGMLSYGLQGWLDTPYLNFAYASTTQVNLTIKTDQGASVTLAIPSSGGVPAKYFTWIPAYDLTGKPMKCQLLEWIADAGGTPWSNYGSSHELAVVEWGKPGVKVIHPFRSSEGATS